MKLSEIQHNDLAQCANLIEALTKNAKFIETTMTQQEKIRQAVTWLSNLGKQMGMEWQLLHPPVQLAAPAVPASPALIVPSKDDKVKMNPKKIGTSKSSKKKLK